MVPDHGSFKCVVERAEESNKIHCTALSSCQYYSLLRVTGKANFLSPSKKSRRVRKSANTLTAFPHGTQQTMVRYRWDAYHILRLARVAELNEVSSCLRSMRAKSSWFVSCGDDDDDEKRWRCVSVWMWICVAKNSLQTWIFYCNPKASWLDWWWATLGPYGMDGLCVLRTFGTPHSNWNLDK